MVVYDDGYSDANATLIDRVEIVGLTSRDQAWKEGRYHLAQQRLRREIYRLLLILRRKPPSPLPGHPSRSVGALPAAPESGSKVKSSSRARGAPVPPID